MKNYKEKILELREQGLSYRQIQESLGCSRSTICYHLGDGQKHKTRMRNKQFYTKRGGLYKKLKSFCCSNDGRASRKRTSTKMLDFSSVQEKVGENPTCYLTGEPIDLSDLGSYSLDHVLPMSKGGDSSLENLGLVIKQANQCKSDLTHEEFIEMCKAVLIHHGYTVS